MRVLEIYYPCGSTCRDRKCVPPYVTIGLRLPPPMTLVSPHSVSLAVRCLRAFYLI